MLKKAKMEIARHDHGSSFASDIQCEPSEWGSYIALHWREYSTGMLWQFRAFPREGLASGNMQCSEQ